MEFVFGLFAIVIIGALYFLPTIVMASRGVDHPGIIIINLLLGWTLLGWFMAFVWAIVETPQRPVQPRA